MSGSLSGRRVLQLLVFIGTIFQQPGTARLHSEAPLLNEQNHAAVDDRDATIAKGMASIFKAAEKVAKDPARPQYHFLPPANWNNDPNGPIWYNGYYHLFYQHNPFGDHWDSMHWGHARSKDLIHWEHLPIALWPSVALGEKHCFSGCAALDAQGKPMIFYTSIGHAEPQCWIALPEDSDLLRWKKYAGNPILTQSSPGIPYSDFRDPFVFRHAGKTYMVHGGNLNQGKGGQACVSLYQAENGDLIKWKYKSILFVDPESRNIECPNFFPLVDRFLLITSPHRRCDYFVGDFDAGNGKFSSERRGVLDYSDNLYAPNTFIDSSGRYIMWGWIRGFKEGLGWNGCMTLPRVLSLKDNHLLQQPAPELAALRGKNHREIGLSLPGSSLVLRDSSGDSLEILGEFNLKEAKRVGLKLRRSKDGTRNVSINYDGSILNVAGTEIPLSPALGTRQLKLHIFLDRSVLEVYAADGRACVTRVISAEPEDKGIELFAEGGSAIVQSLDIWQMRSIW